MPEGMSDGSRSEQELTKSQKCHGVHPLPEVYKSLPDKSTDNLNQQNTLQPLRVTIAALRGNKNSH